MYCHIVVGCDFVLGYGDVEIPSRNNRVLPRCDRVEGGMYVTCKL